MWPTTGSTWTTTEADVVGGLQLRLRGHNRVGANYVFGSGLRSDIEGVPNGGELPSYLQVNLSAGHDFNADSGHPLHVQLAVIKRIGSQLPAARWRRCRRVRPAMGTAPRPLPEPAAGLLRRQGSDPFPQEKGLTPHRERSQSPLRCKGIRPILL